MLVMMKKLFLILGLLVVTAGNAFALSFPRWSIFPLNVAIISDGSSENMVPVVKRAFQTWQSGSGSLLKFFYRTSNSMVKTAQIKVYFVDALSGEKYYEITSYGLYDYNPGYSVSGYYNRMDIKIRKKDFNGKPLTGNKLYSVALQAVGSSMGVGCLSKSPNSVMSCSADYTKTSLSKDDIEALNNVYKSKYKSVKSKR